MVSLILLWSLGPVHVDTHPEYLDLVPTIVEAVEDVTCGWAKFGSGCGPLLLDIESFASAGSAATGSPISTSEIAAVIPRPFSIVPAQDAYRCAPENHPCKISHSGVHVLLDSAHRSGCNWKVVATVSWASRAIEGDPRTGYQRVEMTFANEGGKWIPKGAKVLLAT